MEELKPVRCGCGGEAKVDKHAYYRALPTYGVRCHRCGQETRQFYMTEVEAIEAWNKAMGANPEKVQIKGANVPEPDRKFLEIIAEYPKICTYPEYKGKPYYSIKYEENGETIVGFGTYKPEVLSQYLREYFISSAEPERTAKVIHCIDCAYWMDKCVYLNDGRIRKYADGETFVEANVGINEGAKCLYDEEHGVHLGGYAIFRQSCDFCSKAEKRPFKYDTWFSIKDGIYARRWKDE